jgi:hypothetical protein
LRQGRAATCNRQGSPPNRVRTLSRIWPAVKFMIDISWFEGIPESLAASLIVAFKRLFPK